MTKSHLEAGHESEEDGLVLVIIHTCQKRYAIRIHYTGPLFVDRLTLIGDTRLISSDLTSI
jgi:hypothetical protein